MVTAGIGCDIGSQEVHLSLEITDTAGRFNGKSKDTCFKTFNSASAIYRVIIHFVLTNITENTDNRH